MPGRPASAPSILGARPSERYPSAQYRLTIRVKIDERQGMLGQVTDTIGEQGGMVVAVDLVEAGAEHSVRDIVVDAASRDHWNRILSALASLTGAQVSIRPTAPSCFTSAARSNSATSIR